MEFRPGELVAPSNVSCFAAGRSQAVSLVRTLYQYESPDAGSVAVSHPSSAMVTCSSGCGIWDQPVATEFTSDSEPQSEHVVSNARARGREHRSGEHPLPAFTRLYDSLSERRRTLLWECGERILTVNVTKI